MTPISEKSAQDSSPAPDESNPDDPTDLLRPVMWPPLICAVLAISGGALAGVLHQTASGVGFAAGVTLAAGSFLLSALVIAWADVVARHLILPVGLMTYAFKITLIGMVVFGVARRDWPGFTAMLWGIAAGTVAWVIAQAVWTYRRARSAPDPEPASDTEVDSAPGSEAAPESEGSAPDAR